MIIDGVFRFSGNKRRRGVGSPFSCPGSVGDAPPAFIGVPPGCPAPVRVHDARGNGGGFAPLEASCRRVAGVSWLYWCNCPRLVVVSLESRPRPGPLALSDPSGERRIFGDGGFAALGALLRRVAGVSRLYWCNSPRLVAPTTRGKLDHAPLTAQFPRLVAVRSRFGVVRSRSGAVRSRFGVAWRPKCRPPRRQTPAVGCCGRGGLRCGQNCLGHGVLFAREPASACANRLYRT